ncbi:hypothetical protein LB579_29370 [Mesorhizobium sp. BR1-1-7]|uniref:hypothetical protein n=1 Tax=Mesorhizobium sp. BR1-1-7 TaxID=2876647 RepID=UPI001CCF4E4F|nr:hypothetical protein [Mesorhizobium sp. BR1-1-7]MBZ9921805.1 hypothetical protein [Mesorhizobium sp. BR1-1-7]
MPIIVFVYVIIAALTFGLAEERCADSGASIPTAHKDCQLASAIGWPAYWPYRSGIALSHL